jgi:hypothetical protein
MLAANYFQYEPDVSILTRVDEMAFVQKLLSEVNREHNSHCYVEWYGN